MSYRVEIRHGDLAPIQFRCDSDQTLVSAAKAAGFMLATTCLRGGCGACKAVVISGTVTALSPMSQNHCEGDTLETSYQLICVAAPSSDLILETESPWQSRTISPLSARLG